MRFFNKYVCFEYLRFLEMSKRAEFVSKIYLCNADTLDGLKELAESSGLTDENSPYYCGDLPLIKKKTGLVDNCTLFVGSKYLSGRKLATLCSNMCKSCVLYPASGKAEERYERICVAALYKEEYNRKSTRLDTRFRAEQVFVFSDSKDRPCSVTVKVGRLLFAGIKEAFDSLSRNDIESDTEYLSELILSRLTSLNEERGAVKEDLKHVVRAYLETEYNELSVNSAVAALMAPVRKTPRSKVEPALPGQMNLFEMADLESQAGGARSNKEEKEPEAAQGDGVEETSKDREHENRYEDTPLEDDLDSCAAAAGDNSSDVPVGEASGEVTENAGSKEDEKEGAPSEETETDAALSDYGLDASGVSAGEDESRNQGEVIKEENASDSEETENEESSSSSDGEEAEHFFTSPSEGVCLSRIGSGPEITAISSQQTYSLFRLLYNSRLVACEVGRLDGELGIFILGDSKFERPVFAGDGCLRKEFFLEFLGTDKYTVVTVNYELLCELARMYGFDAEGNAASIGAAYRAVRGGDEVYPWKFILDYAGEGEAGARGFERCLDAYIPAYAALLKEILEKERYKAYKNNMFYEYVLSSSSYMGGALRSRRRNIFRTSFCGCDFLYQRGMRKALPGIIYTCGFKETEAVKKDENFFIVLCTRIFKRYPFDKCRWNLLSIKESEISFFVRGTDSETVGIIRERIGLAVADTCRALGLPPITFFVEVE